MPKKISKPKKIKPSEIIAKHIVSIDDKAVRKKIKSAISKFVKKSSYSGNIDFSKWYCGITEQRIAARINQHEKTKNFVAIFPLCNNAVNMPNAHDIEVYFHNKGMTNKPHLGGATERSIYVYVFMQHGNFLDFIKQIFTS